MMLMSVLLTTACNPKADYGTETRNVWCNKLGETLPSYSKADTEQTREEGDTHTETVYSLCPELDPR
nr:MAG TPA: hypothetical protein [Caudoviricetes sp.]